MNILKKKISLKVIIPIYFVAFYCALIIFRGNFYYQRLIVSLFNICGLIIAIVYLYNTYKSTKSYKKYYWLLLCLSVLSYTIAECLWFFHETILNLEISIPSIIDVFYLLQYPITIIGILYLISKSNNKIAAIRLFFDTLIIVTIIGTIIFSLYHPKIDTFLQFDNFKMFMLIAYPLGDLVLLFNIAYLLMLSRKVFPLDVVLIGGSGFLLEIVTDIIYLHNELFGKIEFIYFEPLIMLAMLFFALSGNMFLKRQNNTKIYNNRETNLIVMLLPYIIVFAMIIMMLFKINEIDFMTRGFIIAILFVIIRQVLTVVENQDLLKQLMVSNMGLKEKKLELEETNSKLKKFYNQKEQESRTDFLTGLYNRRYIDEEFKDCKIVKEIMSVLMVDIDHFKVINDTYGHNAGDVVLKNLSNIMKKNIRVDDILIRFGGEEFICFLPNTSIETAKFIAERLRKEVEDFIFNVDDEEVNVTVSIGVSEIDSIKDKSDINTIIIEADKALYEAKRTGRNKVAYM